MELSELKGKIDESLESGEGLDPYTKAHLVEASKRIEKALDADYVYNQSSGGGGAPLILFGKEAEDATE